MTITEIHAAIMSDPMNTIYTEQGVPPLFQAGKDARVLIVGQAPGAKAEAAGIPWSDASGKWLRQWLGVSDEEFYDPRKVALLPMDFYFPGRGTGGDAPPRIGFAKKWHPPLLEQMPDIQLTLLVGSYAQAHYLPNIKKTLTETVRSYEEYLPEFLPIVHPSPRNIRWHVKNPWFEAEVVPELQERVRDVLQ